MSFSTLSRNTLRKITRKAFRMFSTSLGQNSIYQPHCYCSHNLCSVILKLYMFFQHLFDSTRYSGEWPSKSTSDSPVVIFTSWERCLFFSWFTKHALPWPSLPFRVEHSCSSPFTKGLLRIADRFYCFIPARFCHQVSTLFGKFSVLLTEKQLEK